MEPIELTKNHFIGKVKESGPRGEHLEGHVAQVEKWAKKMILRYPQSDKTVVLLSVWLHDIGQIVGPQGTDHALNSEVEARRFLSEIGLDSDKINRVCHCVRSHRCRDIQPETLEAKILAFSDSSSHMTDIVYIHIAQEDGINAAMEKLERDYRDKSLFPELKEESKSLYLAWKQLLSVFPRN